MAYCVLNDLKKQIPESKIIELTDDEGAGIVAEERVTEAIAKADALIDSYCGEVSEVPFTTVPAIIKQHSITITIYNLYARRQRIPEAVQKSYDNAVSHLKDIASGRASLPPVTVADATDQIKGSHTSDDRKITMGKKSDGSSGTLDNY